MSETPPTHPGSTPNDTGVRDTTQVDWRLVRSLRTQAADLLTDSLAQRPDLDEAAQQQQARQMILDLLRGHSTDAALTGRKTFEAGEQELLAQAIYDSLYGLGRLQPLVDNPKVENISITGYDNVYLKLNDGQKVRVAPVADSDEELIAAVVRSISTANASLIQHIENRQARPATPGPRSGEAPHV